MNHVQVDDDWGDWQTFREERRQVLEAPRPTGRRYKQFLTICRKKSREAGISLENLVWAAALGMFRRAASGDVAAFKAVMERICGPVDKPVPFVQIANQLAQIDAAGSQEAGPPQPATLDFGTYIRKLQDVAEHSGLIRSPEEEDLLE